MSHSYFEITYQSKKSLLRNAVIKTPHGLIKTPCFIPVGTQASVKSLTPDELNSIGVQIFFVNTYHMMIRPGVETIKKFAGLHKFMGWKGPLMTDSGGFQVFSLARNRFKSDVVQLPQHVKVDNDGVTFRSHWDGKLYRLNPKGSVEIQHLLGADIMIAFDDCTTYPITHKKAQISLERTHKWALESLRTHQDLNKKNKGRLLYGSIQGSVFEDLRKKSASFITSLPFDGFAIGGVSVGESKQEMRNVLKWVTPFLPENIPRHLLGVGEIDDIFDAIEYGIDSFDCVMPTRLARMGQLLIKNEELRSKNQGKYTIDILKGEYSQDTSPIENGCKCYTCSHFSRAYLHHLFKVRELLAYRLATIHNLYFMQVLMGKIREAIADNRLEEVRREYL